MSFAETRYVPLALLCWTQEEVDSQFLEHSCHNPDPRTEPWERETESWGPDLGLMELPLQLAVLSLRLQLLLSSFLVWFWRTGQEMFVRFRWWYHLHHQPSCESSPSSLHSPSCLLCLPYLPASLRLFKLKLIFLNQISRNSFFKMVMLSQKREHLVGTELK